MTHLIGGSFVVFGRDRWAANRRGEPAGPAVSRSLWLLMSVARSRCAAVLIALVVLALPACGGSSHRRKAAAATTTTAPPPTSSSSSSSTGAPTTAAPQPAAGVP